MQPSDLLKALASRHVDLRADGDKLIVNGPKGAIDAVLAEAIRTHKAALLALLRDAASTVTEAPIPARGGTEGPLGLAQERLYLAQRLDPETAVYNLPGSWKLAGPFDRGAMDRAIHAFVARHDLLRCVFREVGSHARLVEIDAPVSIDHVDLSQVPQDARPDALETYLFAESKRPFDLAAAPAVRFSVIHLSAEENVLSVVTHAVIWDGWSFDIFLGDISALYGAFLAGGTADLAPIRLRYADYAAWQRERVETESVVRQRQAWIRRLAPPLRPIELPIDRPRPTIPGHAGARAYLRFPESVVTPLANLARAEGTTNYTVLLAAWQTLLRRYSGQDDLIVTTPIRGRERPELELGVGIYTNTLFFRTDASGDPTFAELLQRTKRVVLDAFELQDAPVDQVIADLSKAQDLSRTSLFQTSFSYQNTNNRIVSMGPCTVTFVTQAVHSVYAELNFWVKDVRGTLVGAVDYRADLFDRATIDRLIGHLERLLVEVGRDASRPISRLPLRGDADEAWLDGVERIRGAARADDAVTRTAERAHEHPDRVAIETADGVITFAALERRVQAAVATLLDSGVRPGGPSAVSLGRTAEAVFLGLATLRLGATLVPRRPQDPESLPVPTQGAARGVSVVHRGAAVAGEVWRAATEQLGAMLPIDGEARVLSCSPPGLRFLVEAISALGRGATLCLPDAAVLGDAWELRDLLEASPPAALIGDATVVATLLDEGLLPENATLIVWGSDLDSATEEALQHAAQAANSTVSIVDGPPEAAGVLTRRVLGTPGDARSSGEVLPSYIVRIVDGASERVPVGVVGTVEITAPGGRPVRTSTLARWLPDGTLSRLSDHGGAVRSFGVNVSLEHVVAQLRAQTGVVDAHAQFVPAPRGSRLVAWVVPGGASTSPATLRAALAAVLDPEAVPAVILEVTTLVRPGGGPVDARALPNPYERAVAADAEPSTPGERTLAAVWSELLGRPRVSLGDNFFELGGSSLLALRAVVEIERRTGYRVDPRLFFYQSVRELAKPLDAPK